MSYSTFPLVLRTSNTLLCLRCRRLSFIPEDESQRDTIPSSSWGFAREQVNVLDDTVLCLLGRTDRSSWQELAQALDILARQLDHLTSFTQSSGSYILLAACGFVTSVRTTEVNA